MVVSPCACLTETSAALAPEASAATTSAAPHRREKCWLNFSMAFNPFVNLVLYSPVLLQSKPEDGNSVVLFAWRLIEQDELQTVFNRQWDHRAVAFIVETTICNLKSGQLLEFGLNIRA